MVHNLDADMLLPDGPFTHETALKTGLTTDQIRQRVRSGRWVRLRRGVYVRVAEADPAPSTPQSRRLDHLQRAIATSMSHPGSILGYESAAVMDELDVLRRLDGDVILIARAGGFVGRRRGAIFREGPIPADQLSAGQVLATSPPRTWLDVTRTGSLADGLVLGDSALRTGRCTLPELHAIVEASSSLRGVRRAQVALGHLDAKRETALESASWAYFVKHRVEFPRAQVTITLPPTPIRDAPRTARVDWLWDDRRVIGECDGRIKYLDANALYAEKLREDRLRQLGFAIVRWGWEDLNGPGLAARLMVALG